MKTAYFDCQFGVSGDMILGALVACGVPIDHLRTELGKLGVDGFTLSAADVAHSGIMTVHVDVATEEQHAHRHLSHISRIIGGSSLPDRVKDRAVRIFTRLAEAEARVHGTTPEKVHFHEVGALDAIVDVIGACIGLEYLSVDTVVSTPLHFGTGTVRCAHGLMPVPVPAVVELTTGVPTVRTSLEGEHTTPTGAAIITTLASSYGSIENFVPGVHGYGSGSRVGDGYPNVLRLSVGTISNRYLDDHSVLIETNIDDMNPEVFGYLTDKLMAAGAKDVYMSPLFMKKGRPGTLLSILTDNALKTTILDIIFTETSTLGVRIMGIGRKILERESRTVDTAYGSVRVKVARLGDHERIAPEYEDCARIAREHGLPLIQVYDIVKHGRAE